MPSWSTYPRDRTPRTAGRRRGGIPWSVLALLTAAAAGLAGCAPSAAGPAQPSATAGSSATTGHSDPAATGSSGPTGHGVVVLVTHDSWAAPKSVLAAFTAQTGYRVQVQSNGDAGELTNKLVLTKDSPLGDAVFGIDNTFATRAVDAGVLTPASVPAVPGAARFTPADADVARDLVPIDYGDVCVNVDDQWFHAHHRVEPGGLADLAKPAFKNLFVTPGAATSSPGLAFLLTTIARYRQGGWQAYWKALLSNGVKVDSGWSDAWGVDYTAGGGSGSRPIVLSYASSIPDTIPKGANAPTTHALLNTCFRQVEYAGVLRGARNPAGALALVRFLRTEAFQQTVPSNMYVYPVNSTAPLPKAWARWARVAPKPYSVAPQLIARHRAQWLQQWSAIVTR